MMGRDEGDRTGSLARRAIRWIGVPASSLMLASCRCAGVLDPQGPISSAELLILIDATAIMLVVVFPVIVLTLGFAFWYRASNLRATYSPEWSYSGRIELVVWAIPAMVVILLAGVGWIGSHLLDPAEKLQSSTRPLRVEVVALDWKWLFLYPDQGVAAVNQLVVPAGTPIEFEITSATVMNAFFVPQLGSQIYAMPGMTTHLNLLADRPGHYPGLSSHFSGDGFSDMRFMVEAIPASDFDTWAAHTRDGGPTLDDAGYGELVRASSKMAPQTYHAIDPNLFQHILAIAAPTAPAAAPAPEN